MNHEWKMTRCPDGNTVIGVPMKVKSGESVVDSPALTREELDGLGYNEVVPITREPFVSYETSLGDKDEDMVYHEEIVTAVLNEEGKYAHLKAAKQAEICAYAEGMLLGAKPDQYGDMVTKTWPRQEAAAVVYLAAVPGDDFDSASAILQRMVDNRAAAGGKVLSLAEQATNILNNSDAWGALADAVAGAQNGIQDQLDDAVDMVEDEDGNVLETPDYAAAIVAIEAIDVPDASA